MPTSRRGTYLRAVLVLALLSGALPLPPAAGAGAVRPLWTFSSPGDLHGSPSLGDLDGDGRLEVVISADNLGVVVLDANGSLVWAFSLPGNVVTTPLLADLGSDGRPEVVVGTDGGMLYAISPDRSLLWSYRTGGTDPAAPSAADINADGRTEILFGSDDRSVVALDPTGKEVWKHGTKGAVSAALAVGDFFGDGALEAVAADQSGELQLLDKTGAPVWTRQLGSPLVSDPGLGDLDLDGRPEMVTGAANGNVTALSSNGDIRWTFRAGGAVSSSIAVSDVDSDGQSEVLFGSADGRLYCVSSAGLLKWSHPGGAAAGSPAVYSAGRQRRVVYTSQEGSLMVLDGRGVPIRAYPVPPVPRGQCAVADLDGRGSSVLLVNGNDRAIRCFPGGEYATLEWRTLQHDARRTGSAVATREGALPGSPRWYSSLSGRADGSAAAADVDNDGTSEIALETGDGLIHLLNGSDGTVRWSHPTGVSAMRSPSPLMADINSDGAPEVVAAGMDGVLYSLRVADGSRIWESDLGIWEASPAAADLDGDGSCEVAIGSNTAAFFALNGSSGGWVWNLELPEAVRTTAALADLDGDRRLEAVTGTDGSGLLALDAGSTLWTGAGEPFGGTAPAVGDLDGDGTPDLVAGTDRGEVRSFGGAGGKSLWTRSLGSSVTEAPILVNVPGGSSLDVVVVSSDGALSALSGATGELLWRVSAGVSSPPSAADLDADGYLEILAGTRTGLAAFAPDGKPLWFFPVSWGVVSSPAITDLDRDGALEVIFGGQDGTVYALSAGCACAPGAEPWPLYRHDIRRTGNPYCSGGRFLPDLEVDAGSIGLSSPFPDEGSAVQVNATIRNIGSETAQIFSATLTDNGAPVGDPLLVSRLPAASELTVSFAWEPRGGAHRLAVEADPLRSVSESREDNNLAARVVAVNFRPVALAGRDQSVDLDAIAVFDGSASWDPDGSVVDYNWSFGDGTFSRGPTPTHRFRVLGRYQVTLNVTDDSGAVGTGGLTVTVNGPPRILSRTPAPEVSMAENETRTFGVEVADPEGDPFTISWWLDGALAGRGASFVYYPSFSSAGRHGLLAVVSDGERSVNASWTIIVGDSQSPIESFFPAWRDITARAGEEVELRIVVRAGGFGIGWLLDGNPIGGASGPALRLATDRSSVGAHTVTAVVNASGHEDRREWRLTVNWYNAPPLFELVEPSGSSVLVLSGRTQTFIAVAGDPDSGVVFLQWYLDGAALLNETGRQYSYTDRGGRSLRNVTVVGSDGESLAVHSWAVRINEPPNALFRPAHRTVAAGSSVQFDGTASFDNDGRVVEYRWVFGDGEATITGNPLARHAFGRAGVFVVELTVTDDLGAVTTTSAVLVVRPADEKASIPGFGGTAAMGAFALAAGLLKGVFYRQRTAGTNEIKYM